MSIQTRIYASGALAFGEDAAINNLLAAKYSAIIVWSVHVATTGDLYLNDTLFVSKGIYAESATMNLPARLAQLKKAGMQIIFSVGAGGTPDFTAIQALEKGTVPTKGNPLYDNFKALKDAMKNAGGDIDAVDFDNEDKMDTKTMVNFGIMLGNIGYSSVTFCPYDEQPGQVWTDTYKQLLAAKGNGFVSAIHLQCYSGGGGNDPQPWAQIISNGNTLLIPGLATSQAKPGPWWDEDTDQPGGSVVKTKSVAMYGHGDWSGLLRVGNYPSADIAMQRYIKGGGIYGGETFFFYCNGFLNLGPGKQFVPGDAVYFSGRPWWGSAPQCDGYSLSGGCSNIWDPPIPYPPSTKGSCPADLQSQYATWKKGKLPVNGGFIWTYDSIVQCLLSECCGETGQDVAKIATDYKQAIINGLS
ncbi:MAG TPA: hypothetical protein VK483_18085 [Chitinophagaceae bacterium]|nr:hypothetical protein [Chitinophagaceae bacterium]